ncbi:MAG: hypothetical protein L0154_18185 [Chloroflexi bacterium]|nr:hypothetical protein [Chloroflexota bacterium]
MSNFSTALQFTEYGIAESIFGKAREQFTDPPTDRDTPDVLIYIDGQPRTMIGLEAKMYFAPSATSLQAQMERQAAVLDYLARELHIDTVHHYALVPDQWLPALESFPFPVITWQALHDQFELVDRDNYYLHMLRLALEAWDDLVSKTSISGGMNADDKISGYKIVEGYRNGQLPFVTMGRNGGLSSTKIVKTSV